MFPGHIKEQTLQRSHGENIRLKSYRIQARDGSFMIKVTTKVDENYQIEV